MYNVVGAYDLPIPVTLGGLQFARAFRSVYWIEPVVYVGKGDRDRLIFGFPAGSYVSLITRPFSISVYVREGSGTIFIGGDVIAYEVHYQPYWIGANVHMGVEVAETTTILEIENL